MHGLTPGVPDEDSRPASYPPGPLTRAGRPEAGRHRFRGNQALVFLIVGGFNTALGTAWFISFQLLIGDTWGYHAAIVLGYACNVVTAFCTNRYLVFRVRGHVLRDFWRFVVVNLGAFAVNLVLMTIAVSGLGFPPIPSQLVITLFTAVVSFFGYRDFSFRRKKEPTA